MIKKTKKAPCEVCTTRKLTKKSSLYKLHTGDTHLRKYLPSTPEQMLDRKTNKSKQSKKSYEEVHLEGLKPNQIIFYFATNSKNFITNGSSTTPFIKAYDKLQNSGVTKTNGKGAAVVHVNCPQVYLAEDGQVYSRHFHIIYWLAQKRAWDTKIYTHQIFCNVNKQFVKKIVNNNAKMHSRMHTKKHDNRVLIIDALNELYYMKTHIPGAINIPASHKWSLNEVMKRLPPGTNSTTPMIIYCYSPECNAAEKLWEQFNQLGFYNTMHYTGGISDWNQN
jgi:rhodanese-related sulfurtransferase